MNKTVLAMSLSAALSLATTAVGAQDGNMEAGGTKAAACMGCHGADGNSPADMWPKLAGQVPEYIAKQLHDFKEGRRSNDQMSPMAQSLSDQDVQDLATFFAAQQANPVPAQQDKLAEGEKIYLKGSGRADALVTACVGCHGQRGEGSRNWSGIYSSAPTVLAPAIGSQHAAYVANQLKAYKGGARSNDVGHVMRNIAGRMSDAQIEAVAAYASTLLR